MNLSRLDPPDLHVSVTIYGFEMDSINNTYALHYLLDGEDTVYARTGSTYQLSRLGEYMMKTPGWLTRSSFCR